MSEATKLAAVTETKVVEIEPAKVVLTLSLEEANGLRTLMGRIAGDGPLRDIADSIYASLGTVNTGSEGIGNYVETSMKVRKTNPNRYTW